MAKSGKNSLLRPSLVHTKFYTEKKEIQAIITDDYCLLFHLLLFYGPTCQVSGFSRSPTINPFKRPNLQQSGAGI